MFTCGDVLVLFLLNTAMSLSSTPSISDKTFIEECVQQHNQNRSTVRPTASNMWYMTWDEGLAITARAWSRGCLFEHNTHLREEGRVHPVFRSVGENLWAGTHFTVKAAIKGWVDEVVDYNFYTGACADVCGHYTQVVWADSYKVGCAAHFCPNGVKSTRFYPRPAIIFVCNYANGGNYIGKKPYKVGSPCSDCSGEMCENNLCRSSTRDEEKRYNWTPDWDTDNVLETLPERPQGPEEPDSGLFCKAFLTSRLISLLIIFGSVYGIQTQYPNIFAYTN